MLFIPGNGGSYKQVRSLAAESSRAYQGGPPEPTFYQDASFLPVDAERDVLSEDFNDFVFPSQYTRMLDWFAVDLEGEHSAMDGQIVEEHTEYVVYAIHRILDQYKESRETRTKVGTEPFGSLPTSVILVGHSMGGFVARAALVHPNLRKSVVETVLTLSSPHQSPPVALQPSLGQLYSHVNREWRNGYKAETTHTGLFVSAPTLSRVIVVSIFGGINDYQVRAKLASLDGIVPSTHGFLIGSSGMKNVWLSTEHQCILWCNQLVVQVSHTLLSVINSETGQPFASTQKRLLVFAKMLRSGLPQSINWMRHIQHFSSANLSIKNAKEAIGSRILPPCPPSVHWNYDGLEKDLYIQSTSVTVLAMDGRRRWLDIKRLGSDRKGHFIFVTNLAPCSGVRIHLWPERNKFSSGDELPGSKGIVEVTSKMVRVPSGPAPRQIEPGSQTEQAPPSAVLQLSPEEMHGFRFLTISVAPRPTVSGRPPPAASMGVGQFFNPKDGETNFSPRVLLRSSYVPEELFLKEDHPLALNLSFSVSLGILPVTLSLSTSGCGIKSSEQTGDVDQSRLCKLRCFPPLVITWDSESGLQVIPNVYSETVIVDSSPALWDSSLGSDRTTLMLLIDPHCSYKISVAVSLTAAASRFCLLYSSQIIGFMVAVTFFALMQQARAWELDLTLPSILTVVEFNLRMPFPFLLLPVLPILVSLVFSLLVDEHFPPIFSFLSVSIVCYLIANGFVIILILCSQLILYVAAVIQVSIRKRWQACEGNVRIAFLHQVLDFSTIFCSVKVMRILKASPDFVVAFLTIPLVCFVHPALGLIVLLLSHAFHCHSALCSFLAASFRSHAQRKELNYSRANGNPSLLSEPKITGALDPLLPLDENYSSSPNSKSFGDSQLEIFNFRHGVLILHLLAALMFVPSLVAWLQRIGMGQNLPQFVDSTLCVGVILHGLCGSRPDTNSLLVPFPCMPGRPVGLSLVYLFAGYYSFLCALASAPYKAFYGIATVGVISFTFRIVDIRYRKKGDGHLSPRHSHKH